MRSRGLESSPGAERVALGLDALGAAWADLWLGGVQVGDGWPRGGWLAGDGRVRVENVGSLNMR